MINYSFIIDSFTCKVSHKAIEDALRMFGCSVMEGKGTKVGMHRRSQDSRHGYAKPFFWDKEPIKEGGGRQVQQRRRGDVAMQIHKGLIILVVQGSSSMPQLDMNSYLALRHYTYVHDRMARHRNSKGHNPNLTANETNM